GHFERSFDYGRNQMIVVAPLMHLHLPKGAALGRSTFFWGGTMTAIRKFAAAGVIAASVGVLPGSVLAQGTVVRRDTVVTVHQDTVVHTKQDTSVVTTTVSTNT